MMFKKNAISKVPIIHSTKEEAKQVNDILLNAKLEKFKHASYGIFTSAQHLVVIHSNEMRNPKAKRKTLHRTQLAYEVTHQEKQYTLESLIKTFQLNNIPLFFNKK